MPELAQYITFSDASSACVGRPSPCTIWRWARKGVATKSGERVRLRYARQGRRMVTTPEWLNEFFERTAIGDAAAPACAVHAAVATDSERFCDAEGL